MQILLDKLSLLLLFIISIISSDSIAIPVIATLITLSLSALNQSFENKPASYVIGIIQAIVNFINPIFCCSIPLTFYDILTVKKPIALIMLPFAVMVNSSYLSQTQFLLIASGCFIAFILRRNTITIKKAENTLIRTRDNSEETALLLQEKNKRLLENQDNEITLATMKERNRIAREIHDNVGHMLTRSILQVGALSIINKDETVGENLNVLKDTLNNAMTSIRNSVHDLHNDSINLKMTIEDALKELSQNYVVSHEYDFSETMPSNVKLCFIGIVKECVSNVTKHSNGNKINITIREHPAFYHLSFSDNGICDGEIKESGIGLSNINERTSSVGGIVNITSNEKGFTVYISVPKNKEQI